MDLKVDYMASVREFHEAFDVPVVELAEFPSEDRRLLRISLLKEEVAEYREAEADNDLVGVADALADMVYIICGTALEYGIPLDKVFSEVHRSNMSKRCADGNVLRREDGKILKPSTYSAANVAGMLGLA